MHNPWSSYVMPSETSGEWEATSPLVHPGGSSYLDKVRGGDAHRRGRDGGFGGDGGGGGGRGGRGGGVGIGGGAGRGGHGARGGTRHKTGHLGGAIHGAQSASSSTTAYTARIPEGYMDAYALEGIVADTTVGGAGGADGTGGHKADGKDGKDAQKKVRFCGGRSSWGVAMQHG